jgi:hypothetical protein
MIKNDLEISLNCKILAYDLIILLHRAGPHDYKVYDIDFFYNVLCKYKDRLKVTEEDIRYALCYLDCVCFDYNQFDEVKIKDGILLTAIRKYDGNEKSPIFTAICEELKQNENQFD